MTGGDRGEGGLYISHPHPTSPLKGEELRRLGRWNNPQTLFVGLFTPFPLMDSGRGLKEVFVTGGSFMEPVKQEIGFKIGFCVTPDQVRIAYGTAGQGTFTCYPSGVGQSFTSYPGIIRQPGII